MIRWARRPRAPMAIRMATFSSSWKCGPPGLTPASVRYRQAYVSGGRDGGHRDEHADQGAGPRFGQRDDADNPGQDRYDNGKQVWVIDQAGDRPHAERVQPGGVPGPPYRQAEEKRDDHGGGESGEQSKGTADYRPLGSLLHAEGNTHDRVVFRPHDHGADNKDLGIGEDADRADQPGDGEEDVETGSVDGVRADPGLDDFPYGYHVTLHQKMLRGWCRPFPQRGIHVLDGNNAAVVVLEGLQVPEHGVGGPGPHLELDGVAGWPAGSAREHEQVRDAGVGGEGLDNLLGPVRRADQTHVKGHRRATSASTMVIGTARARIRPTRVRIWLVVKPASDAQSPWLICQPFIHRLHTLYPGPFVTSKVDAAGAVIITRIG